MQKSVGAGHYPGQDHGIRSESLYDLGPSEVENWIDDAKRGMENALRVKLEDIREQYERHLKDLQEAYGEAMLELRARKILQSLLGEDEK